MKATILSALCICLLPFTSACSKDVDAGKPGATGSGSMGGLEELDLGKLGGEEMKKKAEEIIGTLTSKLQGIQGEADALDVRKMAEPLLGQLGTLKSSLADKMPDLSELSKVVDSLKAKFQGNEAVMKVLQPILDQIDELVG